MKKISALMLSAVMALSFTACGNTVDNSSDEASIQTESETAEEQAETTTDKQEADEPAVSSEDGSEQAKNSVSETEETYEMTLSLTKNQCSKASFNGYSYNGIDFIQEDCEWIDSTLNKEGTVEAGAFYRKLQYTLQGFEIGAGYENFAEHIIGFIPSSRDEYAPYVEYLLTFLIDYSDGNVAQSIVSRWQTMESVNVEESDNTYVCTIQDVSECADEMKISEEMLGYILGALHEYGSEAEFDGYSCVVRYTDYTKM